MSNSHKVVEILLGVYETERNRLPQGKSNYAPSFIKEVEVILVDMVPDLMLSNYGVQ